MNREEAINQLNDIKSELKEHLVKKDIVALDMAISALSAEGEYIKKEDALNKVEELKKIHFDRVVVLNKVSDGLNGLPTYSFPNREKGEPTEEEVKEYCRRRELLLITYSGFRQLTDRKADREKGEWIPISERLPENDDDVLATDGVDIFVAWYHQMSWSSTDAHYDEHTPVIAWQPLPEPYKGESEG